MNSPQVITSAAAALFAPSDSCASSLLAGSASSTTGGFSQLQQQQQMQGQSQSQQQKSLMISIDMKIYLGKEVYRRKSSVENYLELRAMAVKLANSSGNYSPSSLPLFAQNFPYSQVPPLFQQQQQSIQQQQQQQQQQPTQIIEDYQLVIKYIDADNDRVSISDEESLALAISDLPTRLHALRVFVELKPRNGSINSLRSSYSSATSNPPEYNQQQSQQQQVQQHQINNPQFNHQQVSLAMNSSAQQYQSGVHTNVAAAVAPTPANDLRKEFSFQKGSGDTFAESFSSLAAIQAAATAAIPVAVNSGNINGDTVDSFREVARQKEEVIEQDGINSAGIGFVNNNELDVSVVRNEQQQQQQLLQMNHIKKLEEKLFLLGDSTTVDQSIVIRKDKSSLPHNHNTTNSNCSGSHNASDQCGGGQGIEKLVEDQLAKLLEKQRQDEAGTECVLSVFSNDRCGQCRRWLICKYKYKNKLIRNIINKKVNEVKEEIANILEQRRAQQAHLKQPQQNDKFIEQITPQCNRSPSQDSIPTKNNNNNNVSITTKELPYLVKNSESLEITAKKSKQNEGTESAEKQNCEDNNRDKSMLQMHNFEEFLEVSEVMKSSILSEQSFYSQNGGFGGSQSLQGYLLSDSEGNNNINNNNNNNNHTTNQQQQQQEQTANNNYFTNSHTDQPFLASVMNSTVLQESDMSFFDELHLPSSPKSLPLSSQTSSSSSTSSSSQQQQLSQQQVSSLNGSLRQEENSKQRISVGQKIEEVEDAADEEDEYDEEEAKREKELQSTFVFALSAESQKQVIECKPKDKCTLIISVFNLSKKRSVSAEEVFMQCNQGFYKGAMQKAAADIKRNHGEGHFVLKFIAPSKAGVYTTEWVLMARLNANADTAFQASKDLAVVEIHVNAIGGSESQYTSSNGFSTVINGAGGFNNAKISKSSVAKGPAVAVASTFAVDKGGSNCNTGNGYDEAFWNALRQSLVEFSGGEDEEQKRKIEQFISKERSARANLRISNDQKDMMSNYFIGQFLDSL